MERRESRSSLKDASIEEKTSNDSEHILQFVPIQGYGQDNNPEIKRLVRQHAMRDYRRRTKKRQEDQYLDITPLLGGARMTEEQGTVSLHPFTSHKLEPVSTQLSLGPVISGSSVNPFVPLPISTTPRDRELFHHLFEDTCAMFKTMRNIGFFTTMMDSAGFHQALSSSAWHQAWLRGEDHQVSEHIPHHIAAVQYLNQRLTHPIVQTNNETIGLVVAFACQALMTGDVAAWKIHINGLEEMVRRRGGLLALPDRLLNLMLHWIDVSGACNLDAVPRFPIPVESLPKALRSSGHSFQPKSGPETTKTTAIRNDGTFEIFGMLHALNKAIATELSTRDLWSDPVWPVLYLTPLFHRLLSCFRPEFPGDEVQDACRLAAILHVREIQHMFGINTTPADVYVSKLKSLLTRDAQVNNEGSDIFSWVLIMGGIGASSMPVERSWFTANAVKIFQERGMRTWSDATSAIPQTLWIQEVFGASYAAFLDEVFQTYTV